MNGTVKNILIFALGAGVGALVTYGILDEKYAKRAEEEIGTTRRWLNDEEDYDFVDRMTEEEYQAMIYNRPDNASYRAYDAIHKTNAPEDTDEIAASYEAPYVIHVEEFGSAGNPNEKLTIYYYMKDNTLVDEAEEIIADPVYAIGRDAIASFGFSSDDPDIVYIRNERLGIDFEVVRLHKSYKEVVLGIVPEPPRLRVQSTKGRTKDEQENEHDQ